MGDDMRPQGLFGDHPDEVETLQSEGRLKELIAHAMSDAEPFAHQIVVILCLERNGDCKGLKPGIVKLAKSNKGAVTFHAADCMQQSNLCRIVEPDVKQYPCMVYYGYQKRAPYDHSSAKATARSLRLWLGDLMPHRLVHIKTMEEHGAFVAKAKSARGRASLIYFTDKVAVPPKLKTLSMEFQGRISLAVVSKKDSPEVFSTLSVPNSLPVLLNLQTGGFINKGGSELHEYFSGLDATALQASLQELTQETYHSGVCNAADYRFCLLTVFPSAGELEEEKKRGNLVSIAEEYSSEQSDPLRIVYILGDRAPHEQPPILPLLLQALDTSSTGIILWRPRWRRFETFTGDRSDAGALRAFIRSAFIKAALDGSMSLSATHSEF